MARFLELFVCLMCVAATACVQSPEEMSIVDESEEICGSGIEMRSGLSPDLLVQDMQTHDAESFCDWMRSLIDQSGETVTCDDKRQIVMSVSPKCERIFERMDSCEVPACVLEACNSVAMVDPCAMPSDECLAVAECR